MFKNVSCNDFHWYNWKGLNDSVVWILDHRPTEVDEMIEEFFGEEGMDFDKFVDWIRLESGDFIAEMSQCWDDLYKQGLLEVDYLVYANRFEGDEESLVKMADDISAEFGKEVRQALAEQGRWDEEDLVEESYSRKNRSRKPVFELRKSKAQRRLTESRRRQISHCYPRSRR